MGIYTLDLCKKTVLVGTADYLPSLGAILTPAARRFIIDNPDKKHTATNYVDSSGRQRCSGGPDLKSTEAYAMAFGTRHALAYQKAFNHHVENPVVGYALEACDSDSEIGDIEEECLKDFKDGFDAFQVESGASSSKPRKRKEQTAKT